ncbi:MAG: alternate-type signal peptide domain-containing protein [Specibacter sp.]
MAKGAIATGVGIILLAGGGGTLATWNQANTASMGSVVAGDLNLVPVTGSAKWTNAKNQTINISSYKVVPGDVLTYTQNLDVTLVGDLMAAKLAVTGAGVDTGFGGNATVAATTLKNSSSGAILATDVLRPANSGVVTASTTFTFKSATANRDSVAASYNFGGVGYSLTQQAPDSTPVAGTAPSAP